MNVIKVHYLYAWEVITTPHFLQLMYTNKIFLKKEIQRVKSIRKNSPEITWLQFLSKIEGQREKEVRED
jgi:hypothetical protein